MELIISGIQTPSFLNREFRTNYRLMKGLYLIEGQNGIGKSAFLNSLIGCYGEVPLIIRQDGICAKISYFNQDSYAVTDSLYWNLFLNRRSSGLVSSCNEIYAEQLLLEFGISETIGNLNSEIIPAQLSGGQIKKIGLIRALIRQADIYLMDEPTNDLDEKSVKILIKHISKLTRNACILAITHDRRFEDMLHQKLDLFQ